METLSVDAEGKVTIPSEVLHKRGLRPGDAVTLVESQEPRGLLPPHRYESFGIPLRSNCLYRARPQKQRRRVEVNRGAEALQEIYPKNPIDPQSGRKGYHEDFKRLDNDHFDLQALKTKTDTVASTPWILAMERLAIGRRRSYPNKRATSGVIQQYAAPISTII
jgi:bifunctional DNA-binding transcriptional regulator/antitoxin component of YhaV-PrlF toxin-antitoxin module